MSAIKNAKSALRKEIKLVLNSLSMEEKTRQSQVVTNKLLKNPVYVTSKRLSIFLSMHDEVQTNDILKHALENGKTCYIPRYDVKSRFMDMVRLYSWAEYESLPETKWKIKQPPLEEEREEALSTGGLDLVLIPGLAFTEAGDRMGRGKGYYDTFLSKCRSTCDKTPTTVALAYMEQVLPEVPVEDTDIPIDIILSPK